MKFQGALFSKIRDDMQKAFNGGLSNTFEGAKVRIEGQLHKYREHPEILINDPKQITILVKGPGNSPHAGSATRPSARLQGVYRNLTTLTDDQRAKIAAIQKDAYDMESAYEKKLHDDDDAKISAILSDEQKAQVKSLQAQASRRSNDSN